MNELYKKYLVSPVTQKDLHFKRDFVFVGDENYKIVKNIPIMLPENIKTEWHREIVEVILWQHPEAIKEIYNEIDASAPSINRAEIYKKYIRMYLNDKAGIINAFESYALLDTEKWLIKGNDTKKEMLKDFEKFTKKRIGKKRSHLKDKDKTLFNRYDIFAKEVLKSNPKLILELATGAGGGTAGVALRKNKESIMFTVDIGFDCLGNSIGISRYFKCQKTLLPVCANFWYLPFRKDTFDVVCTFCGLDESRENTKTISEVSRVLKSKGEFICVVRKNAFMRQANILEEFGFTEEETCYYLKKCRMYSDINTLIENCKENDMVFIKTQDIIKDSNTVWEVLTFIKE